MALPKQTTDIASDRVASAPYNFVPLPEKVVTATTEPKELPRHDRYDPARRSGYFDVHLTTRSPLYVRGALPMEDFLTAEAGVTVDQLREEDPEARFRDLPGNTPDFFYQSDPERPVIPGSSLRGMLRFYLSIVSYGKLQPVSERRIFYRSLDTQTRVGLHYACQVVHDDTDTGFLQRRGDRYVIQPCECVKVPRHVVDSATKENGDPSWDTSNEYHQHQTVGVQRRRGNWWIEPQPGGRLKPGCLAVSGWMFNKETEHVFLFPDSQDEGALVDVDESLVDDFNSDEQLTQFQKRAYPKDKPFEGARKRNGALREDLRPCPEDDYYGEPVHYLAEDDGEGGQRAVFFGRAELFRMLYERTPQESLPRAHSDASIYDYAEALFGFVRDGNVRNDFLDRGGTEAEWDERAEYYEQGRRGRSYAGRVTVTPAAAVPGQGDVRAERALVPRILSTPEPTTVQHYLVQTSDRKQDIKTYDDAGGYDDASGGRGRHDPETALRGHKLYWHQGNVSLDTVEEDNPDDLKYDDSQHTYIRPVRPETRFRFRVRFDNLSKAELGALCWALRPKGNPEIMHDARAHEDPSDPPEEELPKTGYFHKLGMGRPLGMGSVQLDARLHLTDRTERYQTLFAETEDADDCHWHDATRRASEEECACFRDAFKKDVREQLDGDGWWTGGAEAPLREQPRIQDLLTLMRWRGFPAKKPTDRDPKRYLHDEHRPNTRYMQIKLEEHEGENEFEERPVLPPPATFDERAPITNSETGAKPSSTTEVHPKPCDTAGTGERILGRVKKWIPRQGQSDFGFIVNPDTQGGRDAPPEFQDLYFNEYDKASSDEEITEGGLVSFTVDPPPNEGQSFRARDVRMEE